MGTLGSFLNTNQTAFTTCLGLWGNLLISSSSDSRAAACWSCQTKVQALEPCGTGLVSQQWLGRNSCCRPPIFVWVKGLRGDFRTCLPSRKNTVSTNDTRTKGRISLCYAPQKSEVGTEFQHMKSHVWDSHLGHCLFTDTQISQTRLAILLLVPCY